MIRTKFCTDSFVIEIMFFESKIISTSTKVGLRVNGLRIQKKRKDAQVHKIDQMMEI